MKLTKSGKKSVILMGITQFTFDQSPIVVIICKKKF